MSAFPIINVRYWDTPNGCSWPETEVDAWPNPAEHNRGHENNEAQASHGSNGVTNLTGQMVPRLMGWTNAGSAGTVAMPLNDR